MKQKNMDLACDPQISLLTPKFCGQISLLEPR